MPEPSAEEQAAYDDLCADTWSRMDVAFVQQFVADAFRAQYADEATKPIGITFALVGLYLAVERGFSGHEVQQAHLALAGRQQTWPEVEYPTERGGVTVREVVAQTDRGLRDEAIGRWCESVWGAYAPANRDRIIALLATNHLLPANT